MSKSKQQKQKAAIEDEQATQVPVTEGTETEAVELTLEGQLLAMSDQVAMWKDKYLRTMADFDNYRRRTMQEKKDWSLYATEKVMLSLCDVMDNYERASQQVTEERKEDPLIKGFLQIQQQLASILSKESVEKIDALGQDFDPNLHEALAHIPSALEADKVAAVIQNGYKMQGKIIRPARVAVANGVHPENKNINNEDTTNGGNNV